MSIGWNLFGIDGIDEDDARDEEELKHTYYPRRCKKCHGICEYDEDGYLVGLDDDEDWGEDDDLDEIEGD